MNNTNFGILNSMVTAYNNALTGSYSNLHPDITLLYAVTILFRMPKFVLFTAISLFFDGGPRGSRS